MAIYWCVPLYVSSTKASHSLLARKESRSDLLLSKVGYFWRSYIGLEIGSTPLGPYMVQVTNLRSPSILLQNKTGDKVQGVQRNNR